MNACLGVGPRQGLTFQHQVSPKPLIPLRERNTLRTSRMSFDRASRHFLARWSPWRRYHHLHQRERLDQPSLLHLLLLRARLLPHPSRTSSRPWSMRTGSRCPSSFRSLRNIHIYNRPRLVALPPGCMEVPPPWWWKGRCTCIVSYRIVLVSYRIVSHRIL